MKLKEKLDYARINKPKEYPDYYDYIYFVDTRKKHDSCYKIMEVFGERDNEIILLSNCCDVIDLDLGKIKINYISIDVPEYNINRIFSYYKFKCIWLNCSSCRIELIDNVLDKLDELKGSEKSESN